MPLISPLMPVPLLMPVVSSIWLLVIVLLQFCKLYDCNVQQVSAYDTTNHICLTAFFPRKLHVKSPFWILLELRMTEVMVTTGATRRAKLQSNCRRQKTNNWLYTCTGCTLFLLANRQCHSTEWKNIAFYGQAHSKLTWRFPTCLWPIKAPS